MLSQAVLEQCETAVESILRKSPSSLFERSILGQTPLHLAAAWPFGFARLLKAGADANALDNYSLIPLLYACRAGCLKSVTLLLATGSALRSHVDQGHSKSVCLALESQFTSWCSGEIIEALIRALSSRRNRLLELATKTLSAERVRGLQARTDQTLDENTSDVYDALIDAGLSVPVALYSHSRELGTVFHMEHQLSPVAARLFDAGFRDVEGYNAQGLTPLMALSLRSLCGPSCGYPRMLSWLTSKGASLLTKQRNHSWRALHFIAGRFGGYSADLREGFCTRDSSLNGYMAEISHAIKHSGGIGLLKRIRDHCSCVCASSGCTMTISMLKAYLSAIGSCSPDGIYQQPRFLYVDLWLLLFIEETSSTATTISEILRVILFEELGLTHTCCLFEQSVKGDGFRDGMTAEDGRVIQEEEANLIATLEDLLELAISRWASSSGPFSNFIEQFLADEVHSSPKDWDKDYVRKVEDLGVKLERPSVD